MSSIPATRNGAERNALSSFVVRAFPKDLVDGFVLGRAVLLDDGDHLSRSRSAEDPNAPGPVAELSILCHLLSLKNLLNLRASAQKPS